MLDMSKLIGSKIVAWFGLILAVVMVVLTMMVQKLPWWEYSVGFFAFMMCFMHLLSTYMNDKLPAVGYKLDMIALVFGVFLVITFVILLITDSVIFDI
jgi:hypothetical protein